MPRCYHLRVAKKAKGFNTPFEELEALRAQLLAEERAKRTAPRRVAPPAAAVAAAPVAKSDDEVFADEMRGVAQLPPDPRGRIGGGAAAPPPAPRRAPPRRRVRGLRRARRSRRRRRRLRHQRHRRVRRGHRARHRQAPAAQAARRRLRGAGAPRSARLHQRGGARRGREVPHGCARDGRRCVLIIHGRGRNSKEGIPVLKERLQGVADARAHRPRRARLLQRPSGRRRRRRGLRAVAQVAGYSSAFAVRRAELRRSSPLRRARIHQHLEKRRSPAASSQELDPSASVCATQPLLVYCSSVRRCRLPRSAASGTRARSCRKRRHSSSLARETIEDRDVLERGDVAFDLAAGGDLLEQAAHDLARAGLGQRVGEADLLGAGQRADLLAPRARAAPVFTVVRCGCVPALAASRRRRPPAP